MSTQNETAAELLQRIATEELSDQTDNQISIGEFIDKLEDRGYGVLILLCALPNFFPVNVPGISTVFSVILTLIVAQWMLGKKTPWLPNFIRRREMSEQKFASGIKKVAPKIAWMEQYIKPRMQGLLRMPIHLIIGLALGLQIFFLALPLSFIPFSNALPAYLIAAISLGIITRDGLFALVTSIIATVIIGFFGAAIIEVIMQLWEVAAKHLGL